MVPWYLEHRGGRLKEASLEIARIRWALPVLLPIPRTLNPKSLLITKPWPILEVTRIRL